MANPWFRMYAEFATDPKVQMMSEANQRRFLMVLCLRCSNDHVTLQDDEVAFQLRISNDEWAQTKALFLAKGLINEDNAPTAWEKRQFVSDSSAERVRKHREKKKQASKRVCNVTETPPEADTEADTETEVNQASAYPERSDAPPSTAALAAADPIPDPDPTEAGAVCRHLREAGIQGVNPSHPKLLAVLAAGVTADELRGIAAEPNARGKGLAWVLATAEGRRRDAAKVRPLPRASPTLTDRNRQAADEAKRLIFGEG